MPSTQQRAILALLGLTFVTGLIDAASVLGLGHIFVANMTGNVVFLGFGLMGQGSAAPSSVLLALAGFSLGALLGGRLGRGLRPSGVRVGFALDVGLLGLAAVLSWSGAANAYIIVPLSAAMGQRTALVRALAVPDITTTVLTLTLTGLAADSSLAGGNNPRVGRRAASVVVMLLGAAVGAVLNARAHPAVILSATLVEAAAVAALLSALSAPPVHG